MKRLVSLILILTLVLALAMPVYACDDEQTDAYVLQILFGDKASLYENDEKIEMLLAALYLCSEQHDNMGKSELTLLKNGKVSSLPSLADINISESRLLACSHNAWENVYTDAKKAQSNRKEVLQNTVNKVFDFGTFNNFFKASSGKCDSFAALLYYVHILSDYLADDPDETSTTVNGQSVSAYSGQPYVELNGSKPQFTAEERKSLSSGVQNSPLDSLNRCGVSVANISIADLNAIGARKDATSIIPTGFQNVRYPDFINSKPPYLYNKCHLVAHELCGQETALNLITGTRYLNVEGMKPFEDKVAAYIKATGNHVLYRATPVFKGDNLVASGVHLEAWSVEDNGAGICFNVFCYNVQPGIAINYATGIPEVADNFCYASEDNYLPFIATDGSDNDLIHELNNQLEILFEDQKTANKYTAMMDKIEEVARDAENALTEDKSAPQRYVDMKKCEYEYLEVLTTYIPELLKNEDFFTSAFGLNSEWKSAA